MFKDRRDWVILAALGALTAFILALEVGVMVRAISASNAAAEQQKGFTVLIGGDVNLGDGTETMRKLARTEGGIESLVDETLRGEMTAADLFCVNLECALTDQGEPRTDRTRVYRGGTAHVDVLQTLGVDLATLANDHVYDGGEQGLTDTIAALDAADIVHTGAGATSSQAVEPYYFEAGEQIIALVNATQAEKVVRTPSASRSAAGVFSCYQDKTLLQTIREAEEKADYVICCLHWGLEFNGAVEELQRETARSCVDAGADLIVGTHPHCLQSVEFYRDTPIFYSLGSLWFGERTMESCLLKVTVPYQKGERLSATLLPAVHRDCTLSAASDVQRERIFSTLQTDEVHIDQDGAVTHGSAAVPSAGSASGSAP